MCSTTPPDHEAKNDRQWFTKNPSRSFRLRRLMPNEFLPEYLPGTSHVVIKKLGKGRFPKRPIGDDNGGKNWDAMPDTDFICRAVWDVLETVKEFSLDGIRYLAWALEHCDFVIMVTP